MKTIARIFAGLLYFVGLAAAGPPVSPLYDKSPVPPKFASSTSGGNMAITLGSYDPSTFTLPSTNVYNTGFGLGVFGSLTQASGVQGNTAFGYNALSSATTTTQEDAFGKLALRDDIEGSFNTAIGSAAMRCFTGTGVKTGNVAVGHGAMAGDDTDCANTPGGYPNTGGGNTAVGAWSGQLITTGISNVLIGDSAGVDLTTGSTNVGIGFYALCAPTTLETKGQACAGVQQSIGIGYHALRFNQANAIIGIGYEAGGSLTTGVQNVAMGFQALSTAAGANDSGETAIGYDALLTANGASTTANNTAIGANAAKLLTTAVLNTYVGANAGATQTTGNSNTGIGTAALTAYTGSGGGGNTALGDHAGASITSGSSNTVIGSNVANSTLQNGTGNILIGVSSATDTAAGSTSNTLKICGTTGCALTASGLNTSTPTVTFPGLITPTSSQGIVGTTAADTPAAGSVGEMMSVHCVVGTAAAAATSVTISIASPAVVTWTSHTFTTQGSPSNYTCPINFTGTPPTGISVGTNYYIVGSTVSGDTFQISDTSAHALAGTNKINTSGSDGGTSAYIGNLATTNSVYPASGISLSAGDWDCAEVAEYQELTTLTVSRWAHGINTASGTAFGSIGTFQDNRIVSGAIGAFNQYQTGPTVQENISATTTVFQNASASFTVGSMNIGGFLRCRRMR